MLGECELIGYHSTSKKHAGKIIMNGFQPLKYSWRGFHNGRKIPKSQWCWSWFTKEPNLTYGVICLVVDLSGLNCAINDYCVICKEREIPKERIIDIVTEL